MRGELADGEERLRELHQRRQDVLKLVDDLIARLDELQERFEAGA